MWVSKNNLLPLDLKVINNNAICLAILPLDSKLVRSEYLAIKNLQYKMLAVLNMPFRCLNLVDIFVDFVTTDYDLTRNILGYYQSTKLILQFGNLAMLDVNYLNLQNIILSSVMHPENILQSANNKKQAYQDLLLCRTKLQQLL